MSCTGLTSDCLGAGSSLTIDKRALRRPWPLLSRPRPTGPSLMRTVFDRPPATEKLAVPIGTVRSVSFPLTLTVLLVDSVSFPSQTALPKQPTLTDAVPLPSTVMFVPMSDTPPAPDAVLGPDGLPAVVEDPPPVVAVLTNDDVPSGE